LEEKLRILYTNNFLRTVFLTFTENGEDLDREIYGNNTGDDDDHFDTYDDL